MTKLTISEKLIALGVFLVIAVITLLVGLKLFGFEGYHYSEGSRKGTVYKCSKKGIIWKTNEGELSLGLTTQNSEGQLVNQIFKFSVSSDEVAGKIQKAIEGEKKVKLHYRQYWLRGFKYGSEQYDIVKVEYVE